jgi:squalene-hopene/tetraprenyl-beta-curcumene cyclase
MDRLRAAYEQVKRELLAERTPDGHWVGELSSSALATATAVSALAEVRKVQSLKPKVQGQGGSAVASTLDLGPGTLDSLIARGVTYLASQQNPDGGFGDTDLSHSNIATTYLVVAALHLADVADRHPDLLARANAYIDRKGRLAALRERYGIDKTFVVPIMTNLALAGLLDWREIDPLPFELACVPQSLYRFVGMPVVSYAIPALVAIGQARYFHAPPRNPLTRLVRWLSITRSLQVLRRMQPDSGGYLEATPLTAFVVMSLASIQCGPLAPRVDNAADDRETSMNPVRPAAFYGNSRSELPTLPRSIANDVILEGVKFLAASIRPDGSWPIDTNLATWNTTLAMNALAGAGEDVAELLGGNEGAVGNALRGVPESQEVPALANHGTAQRPFPTGNVLDWLLSCQHTKRHPFTGADPGGFGWSDLSGAVPDADDTAGALLALHALDPTIPSFSGRRTSIELAADHALGWLDVLRNRDRGWPTFCRGWGRLPFDRSGTDLTAHALRAFARYQSYFEHSDLDDYGVAEPKNRGNVRSALQYLRMSQRAEGSWSPLWFGNQDHPEEDNPVYGTAKVLFAYRDLGMMESPEAQRGVAWLVANQNADGGWGSGVWQRAAELQNAKCKLQNANCGTVQKDQAIQADVARVQSVNAVTDLGDPSHSVPSTQYLVLSTGQPDAMPAPICNLQSSVEETALAVEALLAACPRNATEGVRYSAPEPRTPNPEWRNATEGVPYSAPEPRTLNTEPLIAAVEKGLTWLIERVERGEHRQPAPIGFYFAKLWYYERLYPLTFTVAALGRACREYASRPNASLTLTDSAPPASIGTTPWTTAAP